MDANNHIPAICVAIKKDGHQCNNKARPNSNLCGTHRNYVLRIPAQENIPEHQHIEEQPAIPHQLEMPKNILLQQPQKPQTHTKGEPVPLDDELAAIAEVVEFEAMNKLTTCKCCYDDSLPNDKLIRCSKATSKNEHLVCGECIIGSINIINRMNTDLIDVTDQIIPEKDPKYFNDEESLELYQTCLSLMEEFIK